MLPNKPASRPQIAQPAMRNAANGFTLVEVMVALAIVAIALLALGQATGALVRNAARQSDAVLAQLCAENALVQVRLSRRLPPVGDTETVCEQAGRSFTVLLSARPTPNLLIRRVDARVSDSEGRAVLRLSMIMGRY